MTVDRAPLYGERMLRVLGFLVLIVPMNLALGGAIVKLAASIAPTPGTERAARWLAGTIPGAILWSILAGAQALADPADWPILPILALTGAALVASLALARVSSTPARIACGSAVAILLASTALVCGGAANEDERRFLGMAPGAGMGPSFLPRTLHVALAAVAVAGAIVAIHGLIVRPRDPAYGGSTMSTGIRWFVVPTALQMVVGFYVLLAVPSPVRHALLGGSRIATTELVAGIILAIAALIVMTQAGNSDDPRRGLVFGAILLATTVGVMALLRGEVGAAYGAPAAAGAGAIRWGLLAATAIGEGWWLVRRVRTPPVV
ncbi:MAG: hypothetical protein HY049_05140 [Acidobacteria bacterium]|nr:hypothetical protein [Acidobacteriota bacterium]